MPSKAIDLAAKAAELDGDEFSELLSRLAALHSLSGETKQTKKEQDNAEELYKAAAEALMSAEGIRSKPWPIFKKSKREWAKFSQSAKLANEFIDTLERDRVKKLAVRKWLCKLLIASMIERGRPLKWFAISSELSDLPTLVNTYFPGYMASGLMGVVLDSVYKGGRKKLKSKR